MSERLANRDTTGLSIAIKCANDPLIVRCLDSIDEPGVSVNAVITPNTEIERFLDEREIPYVLTEYGNIARSAQISVDEAEHDRVIVMDSDAYFVPGAIRGLRNALDTSVVAKPQLVFHDTGSRISKIIAGSRHDFNARADFATNPGLAIRRTELEESCGYIFNPRVRWTEDADLNYRMGINGVELTYVPEAVVMHDPVTLRHELRCAFLYGVGKRLSVENTPGRESSEELSIILRGLRDNFRFEGARRGLFESGLDSSIISSIWRGLYYTGYHAQKRTGHWTTSD